MEKLPLELFLLLIVLSSGVWGIPSLYQVPPDFGTNGDDMAISQTKKVLSAPRLPPTTYPTWYKMEIRPILDENTGTGERFTAPGKMTIKLTVRQSTAEIVLNTVGVDIESGSITVVDDLTQESIQIENATQDSANQFYIVALQKSLDINRNYTMTMNFVSKVRTEDNTGLYASSYKAADGSMHYLASTDFQAPDARMAFPCYDEPQLKAVWEIDIIRQAKYHSLGNMNLLLSLSEPGLPGWYRDIYAPTAPMSSYLVCFAVSDYTEETANISLYSKPLRVWGPPPMMDRGNAQFSPDFSAKTMQYLEHYFGIEYSFPKMDEISIPNFSAGAMENWGLNTYRDTRLLYEEGINTAQDMFSMTNTISHELVHQWWGNLVTCKWWDDLWIQEGAATYYAPIGVVGAGLSNLKPMETLITASVQRSFDFDANIALTHPISNLNVDPAGSELFDTLTYHKGASLIRMMNAFMTENVYNRAMTEFLTQYSYKNADQWEMFAVLDKIALDTQGLLLPPGDTPVNSTMCFWTTQAGYPVVSVDRNDFTSVVTFTQNKYFQRMEEGVGNLTRWHIPISVFREADSFVSVRPERWILQTNSSASMTIRDKWFIVNPQSHGYYRVKYAMSLLDPIINQLMTDHTVFDEQIRSQLVDDNLNLAFSGYQHLNLSLDLTMYLRKERSLFPWQSFFTNMAHPYRMFARSSSFALFKRYVLNLTADALNDINIEPQPNDTNPTILLRTRLVEWRCNLGDSSCINFAKGKFMAWMANPSNTSIIFPDLQPNVYCTAIAQGGDAEWNFILDQYRIAERDVMQTNLLRALACSRSSFRLNSLLDMAINPTSGVRNSHRNILMQAVAGNSAGVDIAFTFVRNNVETIKRRFGEGMISAVITTLSQHATSPVEQHDLRTLANSQVGGVTKAWEENMLKSTYWMNNTHVPFGEYVTASWS